MNNEEGSSNACLPPGRSIPVEGYEPGFPVTVDGCVHFGMTKFEIVMSFAMMGYRADHECWGESSRKIVQWASEDAFCFFDEIRRIEREKGETNATAG